jgi:hypothetical protein
VPDEDLQASRRAYDMGRRAGVALREGMAAATAEHRSFEGALKARRRALGEALERYEAEVAAAMARGAASAVAREGCSSA